jgi:hypothetical protein
MVGVMMPVITLLAQHQEASKTAETATNVLLAARSPTWVMGGAIPNVTTPPAFLTAAVGVSLQSGNRGERGSY